MNISALFIKRPIMTALVMAAILLFGIVAYRALPVAALPSVDYPTIQVSASLPGANPETMASAVATPLERQFATIAGIESMSSTNSQSSTQINIQFALDRNIDAAAQDVQSAIAKAGGQLPPTMPRPPSFQKTNPAEQPVLYLSMSSDTLPLYTVDEYAETLLAQRISMSSGVSSVQVYGAQKYAVRVQLNPDALVARGIGIDEVEKAVEQNNSNLPTGKLYGEKQSFTVQSTGQLTNAAAYRPIIVAWKNGNPVRLEELGRVIDSVENNRAVAWFDGVRGVILAIQRQPGTNTVEVVDNIKKLLPVFRKEIPPAINLKIAFDASESIRGSINDVKFTLLLTMCLVVLVIFLFLRNISATLIPGVAVPLSIIGTFAVMYLLGYSLNNLSMMALTLSVGFVVDDAIVMLENIVRYMEMGHPRMQAALMASREIGFTIVSMTISLVAVFIPVLFMGGMVGRLLHEFSVTITVAILDFGIRIVDPHADARQPLPPLQPPVASRRDVPHPGTRLQSLAGGYDRTLRIVLRHQFVTAMFACAAARRHRLSIHDHADRLHSQPGQRIRLRRLDGRPGYIVRVDGQTPARHRRHYQERPQCGGCRRFRDGQQSGLRFREFEAPERACSIRGSGYRRAPPEADVRPRDHDVPAESTAHHHQRAADHQRVSDDRPERQSPGDLSLGAATDGAYAHDSRRSRRPERHADRKSPSDGGYRARPRHGFGPHSGADSGRIIHRLRNSPVLHHLHAGQ